MITRSTRKLTITEAGQALYQHCARILEEAQEGYAAVSHLHQQPSGTLKIAAPPAFANTLLHKALAIYMKKYPKICVRIDLQSHMHDLVGQGYDVALRATHLNDSTLISQKLFEFNFYYVATPTYLKKNGPLKAIDDLSNHAIGCYAETGFKDTLTINDQTLSMKNTFSSNNLHIILNMTLASTCISLLPEFMVIQAIAKKKLVVVLPEIKLTKGKIYAVYPSRNFIHNKVKQFLAKLKNKY